jgi:hypothetical protein
MPPDLQPLMTFIYFINSIEAAEVSLQCLSLDISVNNGHFVYCDDQYF